MTKRQMRRLANEIYQCELIHRSDSSTPEEKKRADNRVIQITRQIMSLKGSNGGLPLLMEIDSMIQKIHETNNNNLKEIENYGCNEEGN